MMIPLGRPIASTIEKATNMCPNVDLTSSIHTPLLTVLRNESQTELGLGRM
jgi:hypothetical protein